MVEQPDEQLIVSAFPQDPMKTSRGEVESPADPHLVIGSRSAKGLLLSSAHPAKAYFGVGFEFGLVLEERTCLLRHLQDILKPRALVLDLLLRVFFGRDGARPPPAEAEAMERAAQCLPARLREPLSEKLQADELAAPARAQPAMRGGRVLFDEALDALVRLIGEQQPRAAPSAIIESRAPLPEKAGDDRIHGGSRAEEDAGDLGRRATVGSKQRDMHPESAAGLHFALHHPDKFLAFGGSDGDTLHWRPSLSWLDGFGVFTMPQGTVACSIIL